MDAVNLSIFFLIMLGLAALPSTSVLLVVTRTVTHGLANGVAASVGIVIGDLLFVVLALLGMTVIAEAMGSIFAVFKYIAGAYLIWFGFSLLRSSWSPKAFEADTSGSSWVASIFAGFTLTLGDVKAILFYASLFPSLFDLTELSALDVSVIVALTVITVGGVKVMYAVVSRRMVDRFSDLTTFRPVRTVAGSMLMGAGIYLITKG